MVFAKVFYILALLFLLAPDDSGGKLQYISKFVVTSLVSEFKANCGSKFAGAKWESGDVAL